MDEKKLLTNLDKVITQLQSIAVNIGVSTGVDKAGGKSKIKTSLSSEEKAKIKAETEEKSKIYKKTLGLGFNKEDTEKKGKIYAENLSKEFKNTLPELFSNIEIESDFSKEIVNELKILNNSVVKTFNTGFKNLESSIGKNLTDAFKKIPTQDPESFSKDIVNELQVLNSSVIQALVDGFQNIPQRNTTFDQSLIDKTANRFRIMFGIKPTSIVDINKNLSSIDRTLDDIKKKNITDSVKHGHSTNYLKEIRNTIKHVKDFFKSDLSDYFSRNEQNFSKLNSNVSDMTYYSQRLLINSDQDQAKKAEKGGGDGGIFSKLKNVAGFMLLGTGIFLIVQALVSSGSIDIGQTLKVIGVITALSFLFILLNKKSDDIRKGALSVGMLTAALLVVLPVLYLYKNMPFGDFLNGIIKFGIIIGLLIGTMSLIQKKDKDVRKSAMSMGIIAASMFIVIPVLYLFKNMPFGEFLNGIIKFGIVMGLLVGTMTLLQKRDSDVRKGAMSVGMLALAMFIVIPVLYLFKDMPFEDVLKGIIKFGIVVGALLGTMVLMSKINSSDVGKSVLGIAALSLVMGFLVIPLLQTLSTMPWETFGKGITMMGITLGVMLGTMYILGKVATSGIQLIAGLAALLGMTLLLNYFVETLTKFAYRPWEAITDGLTAAGISLVAFGAVVAAIGAMVSTGVGALIAAAGMAAILGLVFVMDKLADSLVKYNNVDGNRLSSVGTGLKDLGIGLMSLLGGSVAGIGASVVNGLSSLFGLDPVSQIQKFEKVDSEKIYKLGLGLKFMGEGLKAISTDVNLKPFVAELLSVTKPLTEFSGALDTFNKTYADFEKMTMNSEFKQVYQNKIESDKSIQEAIKNLNEQELSVQQMQLEQLQRNGELLRMIAEKTGGAGGGGTQVVGSSNSGTTVNAPGFATKTKYFNNLKLASMSING